MNRFCVLMRLSLLQARQRVVVDLLREGNRHSALARAGAQARCKHAQTLNSRLALARQTPNFDTDFAL